MPCTPAGIHCPQRSEREFTRINDDPRFWELVRLRDSFYLSDLTALAAARWLPERGALF